MLPVDPDLDLSPCTQLDTLRFIVRVLSDYPSTDGIPYPRGQTAEAQAHISRLLRGAARSLTHIVVLYARDAEWFNEGAVEAASCWDAFTPLEPALLAFPALESVAFMPWRKRGECGYGPPDQAEIAACLPTLHAQAKLHFPRVDY